MRKIAKVLLGLMLALCVAVTAIATPLAYQYKDELIKAAQVKGLIDLHYLGESDGHQLAEGAIAGMVGALGDDYSSYMDVATAKKLMEDVAGTFSGIGIYVALDGDKITILNPIKGGPSEAAGIRAGDIITAVNTESVYGKTLEEVIATIKGEAGTEVTVTILRPSEGREESYVIKRAEVIEPTILGEIIPDHPDVAYIQIGKFAQNTAPAFVSELNTLIDQGFRGLIIDLRNNGGGDVEAVADIAQILVPEGPIVHIVDAQGQTQTITSPGSQITVPMAVLVNGYSASASEILAGALKDTGKATLIGTTTFGKGLVQGIFFLSDGSALKLTEAKYLTPNKNDINKIGIAPDIIVETTPHDTTDVQLEKAIQFIETQIQQ